MKRILLSAALSAGLATSAGAAESFTKSVVLTTSGYQGSAALADFPVLVKLPGAISGFDYADVVHFLNMDPLSFVQCITALEDSPFIPFAPFPP